MLVRFWLLLALLLAQNMLDMFLLRRYTGIGHETFPLVVHTLQLLGLDGAIWAFRIIMAVFGLATMILKRLIPPLLPYLHDLLIVVNAIYAAGMMDEFFFTGLVK